MSNSKSITLFVEKMYRLAISTIRVSLYPFTFFWIIKLVIIFVMITIITKIYDNLTQSRLVSVDLN
jgi:hypothetical protein